MAHIDAGKTTTTERILFIPVVRIVWVRYMMEMPRWTGWFRTGKRNYYNIWATTTYWKYKNEDFKINIIDTPATLLYCWSRKVTQGSRWSCRCFCAVGGVEPQSETVWRQYKYCTKNAFVNKMDRAETDFFQCGAADHDKPARIVPVQIPMVLKRTSLDNRPGWDEALIYHTDEDNVTTFETVPFLWYVRKAENGGEADRRDRKCWWYSSCKISGRS